MENTIAPEVKEEEVEKKLESITLTDAQVLEFVTTGAFTIEKPFLGGKIIGKFKFWSDSRKDSVVKGIREDLKYPFPVKESDIKQDLEDELARIVSHVIKRDCLSAETKDGLAIENFEGSIICDIMTTMYPEVRKEYYSLLVDGVYNPVGDYVAKTSIKK